jgi:hypothetical protein
MRLDKAARGYDWRLGAGRILGASEAVSRKVARFTGYEDGP